MTQRDYRTIQDRRARVKAFLAQDQERRETVLATFRSQFYPQGVQDAERTRAEAAALGSTLLEKATLPEPAPLALPLLPKLLAKLRAEQPHEVAEDECA